MNFGYDWTGKGDEDITGQKSSGAKCTLWKLHTNSLSDITINKV